MKQQKPNPLHQLSLQHKIIIGFTIPIIMTMIITMFAILGLKQIGKGNHDIREKAAGIEETAKQAEIIEMLDHNEKRTLIILRQLIMVTIICIILMISLAFLIARGIHAAHKAGSSNGLPETARNELSGIRQNIDEILRKY